jgi:hypothetical protein
MADRATDSHGKSSVAFAVADPVGSALAPSVLVDLQPPFSETRYDNN